MSARARPPQVTPAQLTHALTKHIVRFGADEITQELSVAKAEGARNSLAMHVYSLAFDW